jgi:hypothetical protein
VKIWVDDERPVPDDSWTLATTSAEAFEQLAPVAGDPPELFGAEPVILDEVSLDGDLGIIDGVEDNGEFVLDYIIEHKVWPRILTIHTQNSVKRARMLAAAKSIGADAPEGVVIRVKYW